MTNRRTTMAKMTKATKPCIAGDEELRRWCIEQAIRPMRSGAHYAGMQQFPTPAHEEDIIGRADRLIKWVRGG
jgi:hypothetical protein